MKSRGFSLFELLIVLTMMSIISIIAVPPMTHLLESFSMRQSVFMMSAFLSEARQRTVIHGNNLSVCVANKQNRCLRKWSDGIVVLFNDLNKNSAIDVGEEIVYQSEWPANNGTMSWSNWRNQMVLRYQPDGSINSNGSLIYCSKSDFPDLRRALIINKPGRVRLSVDTNKNGVHENAVGEDIVCQ